MNWFLDENDVTSEMFSLTIFEPEAEQLHSHRELATCKYLILFVHVRSNHLKEGQARLIIAPLHHIFFTDN